MIHNITLRYVIKNTFLAVSFDAQTLIKNFDFTWGKHKVSVSVAAYA